MRLRHHADRGRDDRAEHRPRSRTLVLPPRAGGFFDQGIWTRERQNALDARTNQKIDVRGFDIDERSIDLCKKHAKKAGVFCDWRVQEIKNFFCDGEERHHRPAIRRMAKRMLEKDEAKLL